MLLYQAIIYVILTNINFPCYSSQGKDNAFFMRRHLHRLREFVMRITNANGDWTFIHNGKEYKKHITFSIAADMATLHQVFRPGMDIDQPYLLEPSGCIQKETKPSKGKSTVAQNESTCSLTETESEFNDNDVDCFFCRWTRTRCKISINEPFNLGCSVDGAVFPILRRHVYICALHCDKRLMENTLDRVLQDFFSETQQSKTHKGLTEIVWTERKLRFEKMFQSLGIHGTKFEISIEKGRPSMIKLDGPHVDRLLSHISQAIATFRIAASRITYSTENPSAAVEFDREDCAANGTPLNISELTERHLGFLLDTSRETVELFEVHIFGICF
jgi:hypothetical protein